MRDMQAVFYAIDKPKAARVREAFLAGCGGRRAARLDLLEDGLPVFYGVTPETMAAWNAVRARRLDFLYIDNGYFGRGDYYRVTWNALQHSGAGTSDGLRFAALGVPISPWKPAAARAGGYVLIATQSEWWYIRHETSIVAWVAEIERRIRAVSAREIRVRVKPEGALLTMAEAESPLIFAGIRRGLPRPGLPLARELENAWCLVTHSSNTALEAVLAGVPAITTALCAAAGAAGRDLAEIENPPMPAGRENLAAALADNQWTLAEMRAGKCWNDLQRDVSDVWFGT